jgi:hypothetical protein
VALCLPTGECLADTLRVTTWNLQAMNAGPENAGALNQLRLSEAAAMLNKLAPDVILLQQVRDWQTCEQLAQALRPADYRVLVCSAFPGAQTGGGAAQQVALLARQRAYLSWSQPWKADAAAATMGGIAFAAINIHGQRLGFFSVESNGEPQSTAQLVAQVTSVRDWVANRVQVFVVAGTLGADTARGLEQAGFGDVFLGASAAATQPSGQVDHVFALPAVCATNAFISSSGGAAHYPVTCDLEVDPARIAAGWAARTEALSSKEPSAPGEAGRRPAAPASAPSGPRAPALGAGLIIIFVLAGVLVLGVVVWLLSRRTRMSRAGARSLIPARAEGSSDASSSYTVILGAQSVTGPASPRPGTPSSSSPLIHIDTAEGTHTHAEILRQRTEAAEERAARATAAMRRGVVSELSRWLKQKLLRKLITDRAELLEAQHAATAKAMSVEERLARVERQIQQQNEGYQQRIEALTHELLAAKDENRELIRAQIRQVKAEMEAARARLLARAKDDDRC